MDLAAAGIDRYRLASLRAREERTFRETHPISAQLAQDARAHLLGGVPMPWMKRWPGAFPLVMQSARGGTITDVDGHRYIDFCLGDTGAMTGHAVPEIAAAIATQVERGATTMLPSEDAAWVGAELTRRFGLPLWQFATSATDANRFVLRLARFLTQRPQILVFDWCYHGTVDETLVTLDAAGRVVPRLGNLGAADDPARTTRVTQFNDLDALEAALADGRVACVLTEPALTNVGIVLPEPSFHERLRALTRATGTLLAIDETHTICAGPGGATAAWGLEPDFVVIGKPIGGGVPCAAYGTSAEIGERLRVPLDDDAIDVSGIGGTLAGNALALAAMRATLATTLREVDFARTIPLARRWADGVATAIERAELGWSVQALGSRAEYWFGVAPTNGRDAAATLDHELEAFMHLYALNRGILLTPFHNMALLAPSHTEQDVDRHATVFADAVTELLGATI
jgi:glutamate-1-semialdehyde 2,1-aminomutase